MFYSDYREVMIYTLSLEGLDSSMTTLKEIHMAETPLNLSEYFSAQNYNE